MDAQPSGPPGAAVATSGSTTATKDLQRQLAQLATERDLARREAEQSREHARQLHAEAADKQTAAEQEVEAVRAECNNWAQEQLRKLSIDQAARDKFAQSLADSNAEREQDRDKRRKLPST